MTIKQKIVNLISLVLLVLVFWNIFKPKKIGDPTKSMPFSAFEEGLDCKCTKDFVVTSPLKVVKKLVEEDMTEKTEKWMLQTANGQLLTFVHNLNLCPALGLQKNDVIVLGGEFTWTEKGGVIQWTHFDPLKKRQTGYVELGGQRYCDRPQD